MAFTDLADVAIPDILKAHTENTITDPELFHSELDRVRKRGVAFDRQEALPRIVGAAAPIFGPDEDVLGAISISGMAGRINLTRIDAAVRTTAIAISRDLSNAQSVVRPVLQRR